jgi:stage II sporulation protein D
VQAWIKRLRLPHLVNPIALICLALSVLLFFPPARSRVLAQSARRTPTSADDISDDINIGVLGLFHPLQFAVSAPAGSALIVHAGEQLIVLEKSSGLDAATVHITGGDLVVSAAERVVRASKLTVSGRDGEAVDFVLAVPGKILRRYHGTLEIKPSAGNLSAVVIMDRETAVASIVAAESSPDAPLDALKAQAVATRSYLAAGARHHDFDFCDTTHCQFLREPAVPGSAAARAAAATLGLVLAYDSRPIAAMYTRSCSGRTRTPAESGLSAAAYPYFAVECAYCRIHPVRWSRRISTPDADSLRSSDEPSRLNLDRRLGWSTVPSNDFVASNDKSQVLLEGKGEGHGIGLCQSGAKAMAESGADFRQILSHYYPNTTTVTWPGRASANWAMPTPAD